MRGRLLALQLLLPPHALLLAGAARTDPPSTSGCFAESYQAQLADITGKCCTGHDLATQPGPTGLGQLVGDVGVDASLLSTCLLATCSPECASAYEAFYLFGPCRAELAQYDTFSRFAMTCRNVFASYIGDGHWIYGDGHMSDHATGGEGFHCAGDADCDTMHFCDLDLTRSCKALAPAGAPCHEKDLGTVQNNMPVQKCQPGLECFNAFPKESNPQLSPSCVSPCPTVRDRIGHCVDAACCDGCTWFDGCNTAGVKYATANAAFQGDYSGGSLRFGPSRELHDYTLMPCTSRMVAQSSSYGAVGCRDERDP